MKRLLALLSAALVAGCAPSGALPGAAPLQAVETLDLEPYLGTWYEIAKYPNPFEDGLVVGPSTRRDVGTHRPVALAITGK